MDGRTISIHALCEEGDFTISDTLFNKIKFLSTPSARRATSSTMQTVYRPRYFYPRPPRGGRLTHNRHLKTDTSISIHALREEGDVLQVHHLFDLGNFYPRPPRGGRPAAMDTKIHRMLFLSTPSARRATGHALAECVDWVFLSTPSARRATGVLRGLAAWQTISIHALREEGDHQKRRV